MVASFQAQASGRAEAVNRVPGGDGGGISRSDRAITPNIPSIWLARTVGGEHGG
jgi:hypothetical protein